MAQLSAFLLCAFLIVLTVNAQLLPEFNCPWEVTLKTGGQKYADTPANVDMNIYFNPLEPPLDVLELQNPVFNIRQYGARGPDYPYFRKNQVDLFRFNGPCDPNVCRVGFYNGATGKEPGWFLVYAAVRITIPGSGTFGRNTTVNTWLARSFYPHVLAITVDYCQQTISYNGEKQSVENNREKPESVKN